MTYGVSCDMSSRQIVRNSSCTYICHVICHYAYVIRICHFVICHVICHGDNISEQERYMSWHMSWCHIEVVICHAICHCCIGICHEGLSCLYVMAYVMVTHYSLHMSCDMSLLHRHMSLGTVMCICLGICHGDTFETAYVMRYVIAAQAYVIRDCHVYMSWHMSWCPIEDVICHVICHCCIGICHQRLSCVYIMAYVMVSH